MVSVQIAALVLALSSGGDTVLLDFNAKWCAPCRSMDGTVAELQHAGYPVRKVDTDHEAALANQYHVQSIPCFVLLVDGHEVGRITGASRRSELLALFAKGGVKPQLAGSAIARAQSPDNPAPSAPAQSLAPRNTAPAPSNASAVNPQDLVASSVRIKIEDATGASYGSGTIIDSRGGEALVLTCGHVFRDSQGKGRITVDLFAAPAQASVPGRLVGYSLDRDLGLVSIRPNGPVRVAPVAPKGQPLARGDQVVSVGCNNGKAATAVPSRITAIDKFLGSPNLQVAGLPVEGRSGGGLFTADGQVIGVCNAADPTDHEGLYAALAAIHTQLDEAGLTAIYTHPAKTNASEVAAVSAPAMPASMPPAKLPTPSAMRETASPQGAALAAAALNDAQRAAIAQLQKQDDNAEVICIVRSLGNPQAKSEVIMLDHASAALLKQLAVDRDAQSARHLTSLEVPAREPAVRLGTQPSGRPLR